MIERCPQASHLFIAIPSRDRPCIDTLMSVSAGCVALTLMGIEVTLDGVKGCPYIDHSRNLLATKFWRSSATDLLFVDDDVSFDVEAITRIVKVTRPYVGGVYPKKCDDPAWPIAFTKDELWSDEDGLIDSPEYLPTGFLRLNRAVFETMPHIDYADSDGAQIMGWFEARVGSGRDGEDTDFGKRWRARGGKCYLIPDLTFGHTGLKTWRNNWGQWMRSRPAVEQREDYE